MRADGGEKRDERRLDGGFEHSRSGSSLQIARSDTGRIASKKDTKKNGGWIAVRINFQSHHRSVKTSRTPYRGLNISYTEDAVPRSYWCPYLKCFRTHDCRPSWAHINHVQPLKFPGGSSTTINGFFHPHSNPVGPPSNRELCSTKWKHTCGGRSKRCRTCTRGGQVQVAWITSR